MVKVKKIPERTCMGCNEKKPKKELIRVVRSPEGAVSLDLTGKKAGRGAYICRDVKCLERAVKTGRIGRSLECTIPPEVYESMRGELDGSG
ncbi:MAG: YlxR family protein [Oscillospiraceae bacterium]|nr:YlxR family protein [Oscillospiraceae bacterium]MBQ4257338.1 YlxR family protein [Oscillospiraceae bacterium]MBQ9208011.1 YlxR family protein [Oscillospiraceae bacterium]